MRLHHTASSLVVVVAALALSFGIAAPARAAPHRPALPVTPAHGAVPAATVNNEQTLPDTSIDGPALDSTGNETVLAWTGTDPLHHLNVETSTDGLHYGNKRRL